MTSTDETRGDWRVPLSDVDADAVAKELSAEGLLCIGGFLWARARFFCEYCGIDLLSELNSYECAAGDHILPKADYPSLEYDRNNLANTCHLCNKLKRNWDPAGDDRTHYRSVSRLTNEERARLIERCRVYLPDLREQKRLALEKAKSVVRRLGLRP